jgi:hypothetical protein
MGTGGIKVSLTRSREALEKAESRAEELRSERNRLIYEAIQIHKMTERQAAEAAGVSPAYAHRVKASSGEPQSGPTETKGGRRRAGARTAAA